MSTNTEINILITGKNEASDALRGASKDISALDKGALKTTKGGGGLGSLTSLMGVGGPLTIAAGATVGALTAVGVAAFDMANDMDAAMRLTQQQLGLTREEAEALQPQIESVFKSGLVATAEEGAAAVAEARRQLRGLADEDLGAASEQALRLSSVFGDDYSKVLNSINTLQSQFGLTFDEAMDFVTAGYQRGLNSSGDFLDSIGEYSTQFSNGGADAGQFFSILESGLSGGVLGTDKAADAFKEFSLRIADGSTSSREALEGLGIDADKLWADMASGGTTSADAFQMVITKLNEIEDPVLRNQLGVALLGTQYEDLGASAALALDMNATSMEDLAGSTNTLTEDTKSLGMQWESTKREVMLALLPLGEELMNIAEDAMPYLISGAEWLTAVLKNDLPIAIDWTKEKFADFQRGVGVVVDVFQRAERGAQVLMDKIRELRDWLYGLDDSLPDWLRPGSPTPLEIGLLGINNEMDVLSRESLPSVDNALGLNEPLLPDISGFGGGGGGGGSSQSVSINVGEIRVDGSGDPEATAQAVREELLRFARNNAGQPEPLWGGYA